MTNSEKDEKHSKIHKKKPKSSVQTWQIAAGVLAILLVVSVFTQGFGLVKPENDISKDDAAKKVVDFVNNQILGGQAAVSLVSVSDQGTVYNVKLSLNGQEIDSFVTKDGVNFFPQAFNLNEALPAPTSPTATPPANVDMQALMDDDAVKGDPDAPVTIVEFSDFECPFCKKFFSETLGKLDETYIQTGKVKLVYRDFPLDKHPNAQKAAEAAECAGEQGKYYEMHDKLFGEGLSGGVDTLKKYAEDLGLDTEAFNTCLDSGAMESEISKDMNDGQLAGITGTPGFFVNGQLVSGAQPFEVFAQIIEAELAK